MQFLSLIGLAITAYEPFSTMLYKYVKFTRQFKIRSMLKFFFSEGRNGDRRKFLDC